MRLKNLTTKLKSKDIFIYGVLLLFSCLLMFKTFRVTQDGNMQIASKAWSDFAATIPLIRSFSLGSNFPPEYPIFAGPPIRYHFLFYFLVGMLEKTGLPISWALNIPSTLSFFALLIMIYKVAKYIFKSKKVGVLSVVFFVFNGSFSFLEFFKLYPLSSNILSNIIKATTFASFGPYDGKVVSAFWNLNIFTNQRHLAFAYASFLFILLYIYKKNEKPQSFDLWKSIILGTLIGLFPFIHYAVFGMIEVLLGISFLIFLKIRKNLILTGIISILVAVPLIFYMGEGNGKTEIIKIGYLAQPGIFGFLGYWFLNLGLTSLIAPLGFLLASKKQRRTFVPFLVLFVIGNVFQFSPEIAANHKFFNLFVVGINMFSAFFLVKMWAKKYFLRPLVILLFSLFTLSGIIDFFPIINDYYITIEDVPNNKTALFIKENTPKNSVFLNSSYLYHPASIAGRKILMGWPYFAWSAGYDTDTRGKAMTAIYKSRSKSETCILLRQNNIDYFTVEDTSKNPDMPLIDQDYFSNNFLADYSDSKIQVVSVSRNCPN